MFYRFSYVFYRFSLVFFRFSYVFCGVHKFSMGAGLNTLRICGIFKPRNESTPKHIEDLRDLQAPCGGDLNESTPKHIKDLWDLLEGAL